MIDTPEIVQSEAQLGAVIRLTIPQSEIQNVMGPAIVELLAGIATQGIAPAGPVFAHYFRMDGGIFEFEVGVPVIRQVSPVGRIVPGELPARKVARTMYHGGYEGLRSAWGEFNAWISRNGHTPAPDLWERYVAGPESTPDPAEWRTELNRPLAP